LAKLTFFFDRNIGKKLPEALLHLNPPFEVRWHQKEGFAHNTPDDEWMAVIGPKRWVVVGQDWKFHLRDQELAAVRAHQIKCFYLPGSGSSRWDTYCQFIRSHKRLMAYAESRDPPFIFDLKLNGHLRPVPI
jgi:hypothetical protein